MLSKCSLDNDEWKITNESSHIEECLLCIIIKGNSYPSLGNCEDHRFIAMKVSVLLLYLLWSPPVTLRVDCCGFFSDSYNFMAVRKIEGR